LLHFQTLALCQLWSSDCCQHRMQGACLFSSLDSWAEQSFYFLLFRFGLADSKYTFPADYLNVRNCIESNLVFNVINSKNSLGSFLYQMYLNYLQQQTNHKKKILKHLLQERKVLEEHLIQNCDTLHVWNSCKQRYFGLRLPVNYTIRPLSILFIYPSI